MCRDVFNLQERDETDQESEEALRSKIGKRARDKEQSTEHARGEMKTRIR